MGAFLLFRRNSSLRESLRAARALKSLDLQGFSRSAELETQFWTVVTYGKLCGTPSPVFRQDRDNFLTYTGTLVHRRLTGSAALEAIFTEFDGTNFPWGEVFGAFCLILCRRGRLFVIPDRLGVYPVYGDANEAIFSSSFLALLESIERPRGNSQAIYEYVIQGATYDDRTVIDQIRRLPRRSIFQFDDRIHRKEQQDILWQGKKWTNVKDHLELTASTLRGEFAAIARTFGNNVETALSGGYDSRLLLALLRDQHISPRLHVYGANLDIDVVVAKKVAAGIRLPLRHIDKSDHKSSRPDEYPPVILANMKALDGCPPDGIFDFGADVLTRRQRAKDGAAALNGGGGEIFRNFYYLPDRPFTIEQLLWAFFSQFDPAIVTEAFSEERYFYNLALAIANVLGIPRDAPQLRKTRLSRQHIEYLYPCLRCIYWMGRNNAINNRFGYEATPFIQEGPVQIALQIPLRYKNHGSFEADLIRLIDPTLAGFETAYGQTFSESPSIKRIIKDNLTVCRPVIARRLSYRIKTRFRKLARFAPLTTEYLAGVFDTSFPCTGQYFKVERVKNAGYFNRICTLEYLFQANQVVHEGD